MPRPTNKKDLIQLSQQSFEKLITLIDSFSEEEQQLEFPKGSLNRNIRDVLAHLHHWHLMMQNWYEVGMNGQQPNIPAKGYNWRTLPALNIEIREKYSSYELDNIKKLVHESFLMVQKIINKHTNEELFERKRYKWTGNNAMSAYLIGSTSSHYDWGIKFIKKMKRKNKT